METISSITWKTRLKWLLPIGCVAVLVGSYLAIRTLAFPVKTKNVHVTLTVQVSKQEVWATLKFMNQSEQNFYVNKDKGCFVVNPEENQNFVSNGAVFQIAAAGTGRNILWRRFWESVPKNDAILLRPGESIETKVNLLETYDFLPGNHDYSIVYDALHGSPNPTLVRLTSGPVHFSFDAQGAYRGPTKSR